MIEAKKQKLEHSNDENASGDFEGDENHPDHNELAAALNLMPQMIWHTLPDGTAVFFNKVYLDYTGVPLKQMAGNGWISLLHHDDVEATSLEWQQAITGGTHYEVQHRIRKYDGSYNWFLTRGVPLKARDGSIRRWYGTTTDIQEQKTAAEVLEQKVKERTEDLNEQKAFINSILDASIIGVVALDAVRNEAGDIIDFNFVKCNRQFTAILGLNESVIGKRYLHYFPGSVETGIYDMYLQVLKTGNPARREVYSKNLELHAWFDISAAKRNEDGIVVTFSNISPQREAAIRLQEQKNLLDNLLTHSPSGITVTEVIRNAQGEVIDGRTVIANKTSEKYLGKPLHEILNSKVSDIDPNVFESPLFQQALNTLKTGKPFITQYFYAPLQSWLELSVARMDEDRLINVFIDVTPIKEAQIQIEKSVSRLSAVFNASQSGMFIFAPVLNSSGEVVDFRFVITNPSFAGYVGQTPEVLNGALGSTWFPGYLTNGVFDMYKHTYLTGETQQVDIHYNVDQHDLYLDLRSTKVGDEVLVTFNDYTPLKRAQLQLEKYIEDLKRTNANLEEFAYAASHDLKEPIRKIMFFSDRIKGSLMEKLTQEETRYFERMETAAKRMSSLIDDLLYYSQVSLRPGMLDKVDLNYLISLVLNDLDLEIEEKNAKVHVDKLFTITGHHRQLQQAFQNLISNALKYSRPGVEPQITISCHKALGKDTGLHLSSEELQKEYYIVSISDNGIGFEQEDAERIFNVFTRLHGTSEYTGTGIGLSIVRKVIENHSGYITAESRKGEGSTFKVFLPQM